LADVAKLIIPAANNARIFLDFIVALLRMLCSKATNHLADELNSDPSYSQVVNCKFLMLT